MTHHRDTGLGLPEILFAILILGLLAAVAIPPMVYSSDTRSSQCRANVELLNRRVTRFAAQHGNPPKDRAEFEKMLLAPDDLPSGKMPRCPFGDPYVYDPQTGGVAPHRH